MKEEKEKKTILIHELVQKITYHQARYYNNEPEISDDEFDALWDRVRVLDIQNPIFSNIGSDADSFFVKKNHIIPMGSLDKAANTQQFSLWMKNHIADRYIVQHKLDGASIELQYESGILVAAVTRGDGKKGDDIFINARKMGGVIKKLSRPLSIAIRGEVIMKHTVFAQHFSDKANCRNAANGLMKRKDGKGVEHLTIMCYDMMDSPAGSLAEHIYTEEEKLILLEELGFSIVPYEIYTCEEEINEYRDEIEKQRASLGYDIDGLVVKLPLSDKSDMERLRPDRQIAYKFPLEHAQTKIIDIEWSESGHLYTPVAILEPVHLAGTMVKRASLVHLDHIKALGVNIGAEVIVVKRGEIIPKIEKMLIPSQKTSIDIPQECSTCHTAIQSTGTKTFCPNMFCRRRLLFRIDRWCSVLEIDFWGDSILERLVMKEKLINRLGDLYRITPAQLVNIDRIGEGLADKLLRTVHKKKTMSFAVFLAGIGIDGVALLTAEKIELYGIVSLNHLLQVSKEELSSIDSIGEITANHILESCNALKEELYDVMDYITITKTKDRDTLPFAGKSFCFTGALSLPRKEAQSMVKTLGGSIKTSVGNDLDFLVVDDIESHSSKANKAKALGIALITEDDFIHMCQ